MAYKYTPPDNPVEYTRLAISKQLDLWRRMGVEVGPADLPAPAKIGGTTARLRVQIGGREFDLTCEKFETYRLNLSAINLALEAMRLNEARGIGDVVAAAYALLTPGKQHRDPYEVLGVRSDASWDAITDVYRGAARRLHPDTGGTGGDALAELNAAYESIRKERGK